MVLLRRAVVFIALAALMGCSSLRTDYVKHPSAAKPPATGTPSANYVHAEVGQHPQESGFRLLTISNNALMSRIALADHAKSSIDLQYYIYKNDQTGRLVTQHLLMAADRGVRVRILLDDLSLSDAIDMLDALDTHPNIQIRLFNPFHTREPSFLSKTTQFIFDADRLNRRMHNKSYIVDNNVAIVGGRNIGDDYFDASANTNFRDLDLLAIGPVVADASRAFDDYWNCDAAFPLTAFKGKRDSHYTLDQLRVDLARDARAFAESDYAQATLDKLPDGRASADRPGDWFWGTATFVADQPEKIETDKDVPALRIGPQVKAMIDQSKQELLLISPYFVPGESGTKYLTGLVAQGVTVKVLTNSLASTDEPVVASGYARYRRPLLEGGVDLYELRPAAGAKQPATSGGKSSGISLHAKGIVVDQHWVFLGSMNMDDRSKLLNTEMGVIVDCPELAEAVQQFFATGTDPANAYHVVLTGKDASHSGKLQWQDTDNGKPNTFSHDPDATMTRRFEVMLLKPLPLDGML
jgi:putative cardiolipin synthase